MPFSAEAEQSVLGSILIDPERISDIATLISVEDFYLKEHAHIYEAMQRLFLQNRPIDTVTLLDAMKEDDIGEEDATRYLKLIIDTVPTAANILDYARIVREKSLLRRLIGASEEISETAYAEQGEVDMILDGAEQKIFDIAQRNIQKDFVHIRDVLVTTYDHLQEIARLEGKLPGVQTGFSDLDSVLISLGEGDLVLIGARPGMGKTTFAMNIATNVAKSTRKAVCVFSLEMSAMQLVLRMLSSEALVDSHKIRSGQLEPKDWDNIASSVSMLAECDILIDDTSDISVTAMKAKLRRVKNLGLVVIDYLQLMHGELHTDNRVQEIGEISRNIKIMAKELGVPILVCAQLSRGPESRTDKRPMLSDLRDSGAIEQDADMVMFLYRDEYYNDKNDAPAPAECIIAKNRHGSVGKIELGFQGQYTRFYTIDKNRTE